jgi:hypothetical protein
VLWKYSRLWNICYEHTVSCASTAVCLSRHVQSWLQVLCEAFSFVSATKLEETPSPKALQKLLDALEKQESKLAFTTAQCRQIAVWRLAVIMPQQLATDDSFMFNKSARNVRELVEALPAVDDGENSALLNILV